MAHSHFPALLATLLLACCVPPAAAKTGYSLLTAAEAQALKESMKGAPARLPAEVAGMSDQELWDYVPPADLKRAVFLGPTEVGCPVHGLEVFRVGGGFYPWKYSADKPWQIRCPVGGESYPSNDFGAYLKAGRKEKLDTRQRYVDDGEGWVDDQGRRFYFVGYWVFHQRWYDVLKAIRAFSEAYFATGDPQYAHQATVLFCALAEQYPRMDYPNQGVQNTGGMILPWCWENQSVVIPMAECYDFLFPYLQQDADPALRDFLRTKTDLGPRKQIEQRFMQTVAKVNFTTDMYWSNECDHQVALATLALAWDNNDPADGITTQQMVDWIIREGGDNSLEELLYNSTYRDGFPCEGAIGYSASIAERQLHIAELLKKTGVDLFRSFPRLKQVAGVWLDMSLRDGHAPSIGDSGSVLGGGRPWNAYSLHVAWENFHDPKFAQALWQIKSMRKTPVSEDRTAEFEQVVKERGPDLDYRTRNLGGMGLAILESGGALHPRGVTMYYGSPAGGHAHHDRLNIEFFDRRQCMMPDFGYPDQWGRKAQEFTQNTIGHYGVLVDERGETDYLAGYLEFLRSFGGVQVMSARAERCFPGTSLYRRTTALIDAGPEACYLADLFRVRGGKQHDWSFHLPPVPDWGVEGLALSAPQAQGSLAGEDVPVGGPMPAGRLASGVNWIGNVQRGRPAGGFAFYSKAQPPYPSLRMTMLPGCAQEVITGDHESPRIGQKLPPTMKWLLARNQGENLSSVFACAIEACPEQPVIERVERLRVSGGTEPIAMRVAGAGFEDTILCDEAGTAPVAVTGLGGFTGRWAFVRWDAAGVAKVALIEGGQVKAGPVAVQTSAAWTGKITRADFAHNSFEGDAALPPGECLRGQWIVLFNARHRTCYEIARVETVPTGSRVQLTEITPMVGKGYVDRVEEDKRIVHTDTRWRVWGKNEIWSHDFGPALSGYALMNEALTEGFEIEDCKLMPSRARQWWQPEPAWIKLAPGKPLDPAFPDADGDGRRGFWVYDFRVGDSFTLPSSVELRRLRPGLWSVHHCGNAVTVTLPAPAVTAQLLVRPAGGAARTLPCKHEAKASTVTVTLPPGLPSPVVIATGPAKGIDTSDTEPPVVREVRVDGKPQPDAPTIEIVASNVPKIIEIVVEDAKNAIDRAGACVQVGTKTVYAGQPGISLDVAPDSPRRATLRLEPEKLVTLPRRDAPALLSLTVTLDDLAVDGAMTVRPLAIVLGPEITEGSVFLSDLTPVKAFAHAGLIRDRNYTGGELRLGGARYPKGLMLCPEVTNGPVNYGEAIYALPPGKFRTFRAIIGIEDSAGPGDSIFSVQLRKGNGEWQTALKSGIITKGTPPQAVATPLGDADELRLYTDANGDISCDHAVFAAARLEP